MDAALASSRILDDHPILLATIHLPEGNAYACDQAEDVVSRGITFLKGLGIETPADDGKPVKSSLTVANVGNRVANLIELMEIRVAVTLELVMASDPDVPVETHRGLVIRSASTGKIVSSFSLVQDIPVDEPVSGLRATAEHFPGVVYAF